jgi:hypothetical protein
MEKLKLSKDVELPLEVITERVACVGQSGSGKTYAAMRLAELMLEAGAQVVALDPMGVWWGLLSTADGKASGFPVHVFGGEHAHVPIVPEAGGLVAEVIVTRGISAVIDISHFTRSEQVMFASAFAERFYELQVKVKRPVHLFFEEAHTVMPQNLPAEGRGGDPKKNPAVMLNRMERIVRQGRSQGIGCTMITQQPQAVNKAALNQAGTLLAMRTMGKHERKAIADWMADKATDDAQLKLDQLLPKLGTGEAWVASPHFLGIFVHTRVSKKKTFDSSATPKFGVKLEAPKVLAAVDVEALREAMKTVVEEVEKDDPAPLRRRVTELERELAAAHTRAKTVEVPVIDGKDRQVIDRLSHELSSIRPHVDHLISKVDELHERLGAVVAKYSGAPPAPLDTRDFRSSRAAPAARSPGPAPKLDGTGLKKGAREMLRELAALHPKSLTRRELATRVTMAHDGGSVGDYISALRAVGYLEDDENGDLRATAAGLKAAGSVTAKSAGELVALWKAKPEFKRGVRAMFDALLASPTTWFTREQLAEAAGMEASGGSTGDYISALASSGCADARVPRGGPWIAGHALFMGDR